MPPNAPRLISSRYWNQITWAWNKMRFSSDDRKRFVGLLEQDRWYPVDGGNGCFKKCYAHSKYDVVLKFDSAPSSNDIRSNHSHTEWGRWKRAPPRVRRYLAPIYRWENGLIAQLRVRECQTEKCRIPWKIRRIVRTTHPHHHTHVPRLLFFDYDSFW